MFPVVWPAQRYALSLTRPDARGTIAMAMLNPPAHPELELVDAARVMRCSFSNAVTRATCAGVVNAVVFGAPYGGGRPGWATVTCTLARSFQSADELLEEDELPHAARVSPAHNAPRTILTGVIMSPVADRSTTNGCSRVGRDSLGPTRTLYPEQRDSTS